MSARRALAAALAGAVISVAFVASLPAQDTIPPEPDTIAPPPEPVLLRPVIDTAGDREGRPGSAGSFLRSVLVPGWGQAEYDAYFRGGVYFTVASTNWFMLFRSFKRLDMANQMRDARFAQVRRALEDRALADPALAQELEDPLRAEELILQDSVAADMDGLVESREQQREDWIAWTIFWTLASGVDALVTAQLSDFPEAVTATPTPDGGMRLHVRLPFGPGPPRRRR